MCAAFPRSEYYQRVRLPPSLLSPSGWSIRLTYSACISTDQDGGGSPRCHDASVSVHAVLLDPAGVSSDHRLLRSPTVAFQVFDPVGLRICHEAQSLHLRYGLDIALSTLNSCRHLHEPKTRFPVGRLVPFPGRESHPLKAPGLSWRTEKFLQVEIHHPAVSFGNVLLRLMHRLLSATPRSETVAVFGERRVPALLQNLQHRLLDEPVQHTRNA